MLDWSIAQTKHPVAIRVPGGAFVSDGKAVTKDFSKLNKYEITKQGSKVAIIGLGSFYGLGVDAAKALKEATSIEATIINPYYITGLDEAMLKDLKANSRGGYHTRRWHPGRWFRREDCPVLRSF